MIQIAICDDNKLMTSVIEEMLYKTANEQNIPIDCAVFFDGSTLVENIRQGTCYDLIYLDIEMNQMDGISAAKLIRGMDIPVLIVYVSGCEQYLKELFVTEPFRFLLKPIDTRSFDSVFLDAYKRIMQRAEYFSYTFHQKTMKIPLHKIYYFESRNRVIYIHMAGNCTIKSTDFDESEYRFYGKMNDVEKQILKSNLRFMRIHQSYLVNFDYIQGMDSANVSLADKILLPISEDRQKNVRAQFMLMNKNNCQSKCITSECFCNAGAVSGN